MPALLIPMCYLNTFIGDKSKWYAQPGDAGIDLYASIPSMVVILAGRTEKIACGIKVAIPEKHVGLVCPRSGLAAKHGVTVLNGPGIIDSQYRGEVCVLLHNTSSDTITVRPGDRIAQLVVTPYATTERDQYDEKAFDAEFGNTKRGSGGFGSTGG